MCYIHLVLPVTMLEKPMETTYNRLLIRNNLSGSKKRKVAMILIESQHAMVPSSASASRKNPPPCIKLHLVMDPRSLTTYVKNSRARLH